MNKIEYTLTLSEKLSMIENKYNDNNTGKKVEESHHIPIIIDNLPIGYQEFLTNTQYIKEDIVYTIDKNCSKLIKDIKRRNYLSQFSLAMLNIKSYKYNQTKG